MSVVPLSPKRIPIALAASLQYHDEWRWREIHHRTIFWPTAERMQQLWGEHGVGGMLQVTTTVGGVSSSSAINVRLSIEVSADRLHPYLEELARWCRLPEQQLRVVTSFGSPRLDDPTKR